MSEYCFNILVVISEYCFNKVISNYCINIVINLILNKIDFIYCEI